VFIQESVLKVLGSRSQASDYARRIITVVSMPILCFETVSIVLDVASSDNRAIKSAGLSRPFLLVVANPLSGLPRDYLG
jgi:hypothetical protein